MSAAGRVDPCSVTYGKVTGGEERVVVSIFLVGVKKKKRNAAEKRKIGKEKNYFLSLLLTLPVNWSATELLLTEFQNLDPAAVSPGR